MSLKILAEENRGVLLDIVVFFLNLLLMQVADRLRRRTVLSELRCVVDLFSAADVLPRRRHSPLSHVADDAPRELTGDHQNFDRHC